MKENHETHYGFCLIINIICLSFIKWASGFGSMGPLSGTFGDKSFFCAIDASGKQELICWGKNSTSKMNTSSSSNPSASLFFSATIPPMAALSGGYGFMCGILANTSQAYCWDSDGTSTDLIPSTFQTTAYSHIAAGKDHVCAVRGSYFSENDLGTVDCWDIFPKSNNSFGSKQSYLFHDSIISNLVLKNVVSGDGFSCGSVREGGFVCWGPNSSRLNVSNVSDNFLSFASGLDSLCGVSETSGQVNCWGNNISFLSSSIGLHSQSESQFISMTSGSQHFCGIRQDNHGIECWGNFNSSSVPKGPGFFAIASSDVITCGIREEDLVLDCWFMNASSQPEYDPPLQLCSPGLCQPGSCGGDMFAFNASNLNEQDLTSLCIRKDLKMCYPCGFNCSDGYFLSSSCSENSDRVCTACSLCQNSSCWDVCGLLPSNSIISQQKHMSPQLHRLLLIIIVSSSFGLALVLTGLRFCVVKNRDPNAKKFGSCIRNEPENKPNIDHIPSPVSQFPGIAQVFRLSELKDATNGFKEFNELGRGSYGFVYKAVLADGKIVAVKRANAATIIHTNSREFETELEILCNARHNNIVNLLGYCTEMGERILVYEFMPNGTLNDHLHNGLSPLNWSLRLKIALQAAKGLEYLHNDAIPPIVHRHFKTANVFLDAEWNARVADFGLIAPSEKDLSGDVRDDVYNFGIVLLEILSGRKAYDRECTPPSIIDWALPIISRGRAAALIDRYTALPRNVEPLLKLVDLAELLLKENPSERPNMSDAVLVLEQLVKDGLIL
ncbi:serine/threonine-protein kinase-like protein CCR1 [Impatiens glandulifera]|uniref:serine/threonine-protein kinase-like protein CCR1 n=1 Tax=Impatiens glandulifera TaxID=253017 RepID=UPI001FB09485|nr:serine/threonine-protein kinase-like protein CCR1 [Impatiens glandulifera]